MFRAIIIDDETDAINVLTHLLRDFTTIPVKIVGTATNLQDGVSVIRETKPDIVFLDIDMPEHSGLEIFHCFEEIPFKVVFVTAYNQYAIDAIKNSASDYLLKPVSFLELKDCLIRLGKQVDQEQKRRELEDKISLISASEIDGKVILLDVDSGFVMENTKNIEYCYANQSYSVIVTYVGREIVVTKPLKELQKILPETQFYRTHKSYLVNIHYIRKFVRANESYVLLKSGAKIPVSVRNSIVISKDIKQLLSN